MAFGLLLFRVVLGGLMAAHGAQKAFGWFGGPGREGTKGMADAMGLRPAKAHAGLLQLSELGGGLLIVLGLLTPLAAAMIIGVMTVAFWLVHRSNGFFNGNGGYEFNLLIAAGAAALAFIGPGAWSLDRVIGWDIAGIWWGI